MMKVTLRISNLLFALLLWSAAAWAQPANDDCANAATVTYATSEATAVLTNGDSRGATASTTPTTVCSGSWYTDDTWYKFSTPAVLPPDGIVVRVYFNNAVIATDVPAIGMALYQSCAAGETALGCFSSDLPEDNKIEIPGACLQAGEDYYVRVWSTGADATTEGTFRVAAFANTTADASLYWETFAGGIEANGWTTTGTCAVADSNINAGWKYLPNGLIDMGAYIFAGAAINSPTLCDGAVGVDSDFNDNAGIEGNFGNGPCPTPGEHFLVSPVIYSGAWTGAGLSLTWTQALRQFQSTYMFSYRTKDVGGDWADWTNVTINTEFATNGNFETNDVQRFFMPGAAGHDSLQVRFVYNDNYYMWAIDDVKIVETECNNLRVQTNFYAIAPWATIPADQVREFAALADIYNAGACPQTNVVLNHTVIDTATGAVVYNENLAYGTVGPDSLAENKLFPELINLPKEEACYQATYTLTSDSTDFDPTDNTITSFYCVGGNVFGHEDGFTRSVAVNGAIYDPGAPLSYAYGNVFKPEVDATVDHIIWGVNNPDDMAGKTVSIYLLQWTDTNGDLIAENSERRFVGFNDYTFTGTEGDNAILQTELENFDNPGDPVVMRAGFQYIALVEYVATDQTQFFLLASEDRDYGAQVLAMDSAFAHGLTTERLFMTALGFSPDGNIANIDYEVRELDVNDTRVYFGDDIVPMIRVVVQSTINTNDELPINNLVAAYPNPATDQVSVKLEFTQPYDDVQLRLINNIGQTVFEKVINTTITVHTESINVSALATGNYLLQVETPDGQRSVPVIVIK
jgi:hypothetical protein